MPFAKVQRKAPARHPIWLALEVAFYLTALVAAQAAIAAAPLGAPNNEVFRVGFSASTFTDVNPEDAKAAIKIWAQVLAKERGLPMEGDPQVLGGLKAISQALRDKAVDAIALNTDEYWKLRDQLDTSLFIAGINDGQITDEYVVLVHQDSGMRQIGDLRGRRFLLFQNSRMSLGPAWLDTILFKDGFQCANEFLELVPVKKLSKAVLPVFFRQADACIVTRRGLKTMSELNPQIGQRLKVIASSPSVVPSGFCFRRDYSNPLRERIVRELQKIMSTPAGAQVLMLFQSGSLQANPVSCLDSAFELLATHARLLGGTNKIKTVAAGEHPSLAKERKK